MVTGPVGILALQGGYQRHADRLDQLAVAWRLVRTVQELDGCKALILPGGESTAMTQLLHSDALFQALQDFTGTHPVLGTCAGLILMGRSADTRVHSLALLDVEVARNAYGRQAQSFHCSLNVELGQGSESFPGIFIRAPRILRTGPTVEVLARHDGNAVLVAQGPHLGMSFHPELTADARIHRYWLVRAQLLQCNATCGGVPLESCA